MSCSARARREKHKFNVRFDLISLFFSNLSRVEVEVEVEVEGDK